MWHYNIEQMINLMIIKSEKCRKEHSPNQIKIIINNGEPDGQLK